MDGCAGPGDMACLGRPGPRREKRRKRVVRPLAAAKCFHAMESAAKLCHIRSISTYYNGVHSAVPRSSCCGVRPPRSGCTSHYALEGQRQQERRKNRQDFLWSTFLWIIGCERWPRWLAAAAAGRAGAPPRRAVPAPRHRAMTVARAGLSNTRHRGQILGESAEQPDLTIEELRRAVPARGLNFGFGTLRRVLVRRAAAPLALFPAGPIGGEKLSPRTPRPLSPRRSRVLRNRNRNLL